jgi:hypothetical protein
VVALLLLWEIGKLIARRASAHASLPESAGAAPPAAQGAAQPAPAPGAAG